eukprot:TRINITY_DN758_c5_g1_i1.p1 TRINITY_DN758_c5_g1~~TRINITY_DN758_c5_g1_i1.p1  ORF type:complete len:477 (+),score=221.35 TRINITY_DN758_c5_g1_i1:43-1431(+)
MSGAEYIGRRISLISKAEIRYEGTLQVINKEQQVICMSDVKVLGTENRQADKVVLPKKETYASIFFRTQDIKDLHIIESPAETMAHEDPAIVSVTASAAQIPVDTRNVSRAPAGTGSHLAEKGKSTDTAEEFDFVAAGQKFNKEEEMAKMEADVEDMALSKGSFFDSLKSQARLNTRQEKMALQNQQKTLNVETFGAEALSHHVQWGTRGRGGHRGRGRGGRGGFNRGHGGFNQGFQQQQQHQGGFRQQQGQFGGFRQQGQQGQQGGYGRQKWHQNQQGHGGYGQQQQHQQQQQTAGTFFDNSGYQQASAPKPAEPQFPERQGSRNHYKQRQLQRWNHNESEQGQQQQQQHRRGGYRQRSSRGPPTEQSTEETNPRKQQWRNTRRQQRAPTQQESSTTSTETTNKPRMNARRQQRQQKSEVKPVEETEEEKPVIEKVEEETPKPEETVTEVVESVKPEEVEV